MQYILFSDDIRELSFSTRLLNVLRSNGVITVGDFIRAKENKNLENFRRLGEKSISDIKNLFESLYIIADGCCVIASNDQRAITKSDELFYETYKNIVKELSEAYDIKISKCWELLTDIREKFPDAEGGDLMFHLYENSYLHDVLHKNILSIFEDNYEQFRLENIMEKLPQHLRNTKIVEDLLLSMTQKEELVIDNDMYKLRQISIMNCVNNISDARNRQIMIDRFNGKNLKDIGNMYGITKERVRQIYNRELRLIRQGANNKIRRFSEDQYAYVFANYMISESEFIKFFNEPLTTYRYLLATVSRNKELKPFNTILEDETVPITVRKRVENFIYKDHIVINGERIHKDRQSLAFYYIKNYCKKSIRYEVFVRKYDNFIDDLGLSEEKNLKIGRCRFDNRLNDYECLLWKQWREFRYYDISSKDHSILLEKINLMQYDGLEISTLKIFRDNPELMNEYDIQDEYELHNLLRKIWDPSDKRVVFRRMPNLEIGKVDREAQILSLLTQHDPISAERFSMLYEELYGIKAATMLGGYMKNFEKYLANGIYSLNAKQLPEDRLIRLKEILVGDYYTMKDLQRIYRREFPDADVAEINPYTAKKLGFKVYSGYVVRNTFNKANKYFDHFFIGKDIIDLQKYNFNKQHIGAFTSKLYKLRSEREIVEFKKGKYISIRKLNQLGVTKEMMEDYCHEVRCFVNDGAFFTIRSIIADGFSHELDSFDFDEIFYIAVLFEDKKHFSSQRLGGTRIFINGKSKDVITDMVKTLMGKKQKINLYYLRVVLENRYGVIVSKDKLVSVIKDTNMYYDDATQSIYPDHDAYNNRV